MAMSERRAADPPVAPADRSEPRGFRPASRRRSRLAAGAILAAIAIGGNVLLYASLDDQTEVLQLVRNVRAGEVVTSEDLRIVEVDLDPTVPSVAAGDIGLVVNRYARVYLPSGTLIFDQLVQSTPLVSDGAGVVAVEIRATRLPSGLSTRSQVLLVVVEGGSDELFVTEGRVVRRGTDGDEGGALSVEVAVADAPRVAAADDVRVVLIEPGVDPATERGANGG
ncbi:MAG: SAF domain-containing protein [Ilumatobacteraceae bacterium]|nr:SAF domain-containing protein [Ilumatobacteraceae bacterium]